LAAAIVHKVGQVYHVHVVEFGDARRNGQNVVDAVPQSDDIEW
jgi:hypothetical protein